MLPQNVIDFLMAKADLTHTPIEGSFELTPICNMRCRMCYVRLNPPDVQSEGGLKTAAEWLEIAKEVFDAGTLFILLTGGEPLLHPQFEEIYVKMMKMGFTISINSNGTLIDEHYIELFKKYPPKRINITLYGFSRETYESLCDYGDGFEKTMNAIRRLKEENINICIHIMTTKLNQNDIPQILQFAAENEILVEASAFIFKPTRCNREFEYRLTPSEAAEFSALYSANKYNDPDMAMISEAFRHNRENGMSPSISRCMNCRAGASTFWIAWSGKMMMCGMMPFPSMNLKDHSFSECWDYLGNERGNIILPESCGNCKERAVCQVCAAKAYAENGNLTEKPEYICKITEAMGKLMI